MNPLEINPQTGFIESNNSNGFTSERKVQFLELAKECRQQGKFPDVNAICRAIGINFSTFERHLASDDQFKAIWSEIASSIEYDCIADMHDLRRKNPMYMFGLLRYLNPSRWNPGNTQGNQANISIFIDNLKEMKQVVEASVVPTEKT